LGLVKLGKVRLAYVGVVKIVGHIGVRSLLFTERNNNTNPGGLHSREQSRSRSRTSIVSRLTFENSRDYPSRRDQFFFISVEIFKIKTFQSRFRCVEIFIEIVETSQDFRDKSRLSRQIEIIETNRDYQDFSRFIEISQHF
jgi:hypothetical protein